MRHKEARRATMLGREWLALELPDNEPLSIQQILEGIGAIRAVSSQPPW
jgi:hypothetical protein